MEKERFIYLLHTYIIQYCNRLYEEWNEGKCDYEIQNNSQIKDLFDNHDDEYWEYFVKGVFNNKNEYCDKLIRNFNNNINYNDEDLKNMIDWIDIWKLFDIDPYDVEYSYISKK